MIAAAAEELAASRKEAQLLQLSTTHHFVPLAFESMGPRRFQSHEFFKRTQSSLNTHNGQPFVNCITVYQRLSEACAAL